MRANTFTLRAVAVAAGFAAVLGTSAAYAADVVYQEPPAAQPLPMEQAPLATWAGAYAGVSLGYGFGNNTTITPPNTTVGSNGIQFGGFAGYNFQAGSLVYGVEGDIGYNGAYGNNGLFATRRGLEGSLRGRVGFAPNDALLVYATGGAAATQQRIYDAAGEASNGKIGYTVGAGIEAKMTNNVFGRVEYRYSNFGTQTLNTGSGARDVSSQDHRIGVGLGIKF